MPTILKTFWIRCNQRLGITNHHTYWAKQTFLAFYILDCLFNSHLLTKYDLAHFWSIIMAAQPWLDFLPIYSAKGAMLASIGAAWLASLLFFGFNRPWVWWLLTFNEFYLYFSNYSRSQNHKYLLVILFFLFSVSQVSNKDNKKTSSNLVGPLLFTQFGIVYFFAGLAKLKGTHWLSGQVLEALGLLKFFPFTEVSTNAYNNLLLGMSYFVLVFEIVLPFGIFFLRGKWRILFVLMGIGFHGFIFFTMAPQIKMFSIMAMTFYVLFLPTNWFESLTPLKRWIRNRLEAPGNLAANIYLPVLSIVAWFFLAPETLRYLDNVDPKTNITEPTILYYAGIILVVVLFMEPMIIVAIKAKGNLQQRVAIALKRTPIASYRFWSIFLVTGLFVLPVFRQDGLYYIRQSRESKEAMTLNSRRLITERVEQLHAIDPNKASNYLRKVGRVSSDRAFLVDTCRKFLLDCELEIEDHPPGFLLNSQAGEFNKIYGESDELGGFDLEPIP